MTVNDFKSKLSEFKSSTKFPVKGYDLLEILNVSASFKNDELKRDVLIGV